MDIVRSYASQFSAPKESVIRESVVGRLELERRMGQLLPARDGTVVVRDDNGKFSGYDPAKRLPEWISRDVSSAAHMLARTPSKWFDKVIEAIRSGERRPNVREIYLEASPRGRRQTGTSCPRRRLRTSSPRSAKVEEMPENATLRRIPDPPIPPATPYAGV
jgi:hypothetical protein